MRRNEKSPTTYINIGGPGTTALPERADPNAEPSWETVSSEPKYEWPDHRTHWTSAQLPPEVLADPKSAHRVMEWTIQLKIGDTTYDIAGVLDWTPPPPAWLPPAWAARTAVLLLLGPGVGLALGSFGLLRSRAKTLPDKASEAVTS